jgi:hypothetical protein
MDDMSPGRPVGSTYLELWCRAYEDSLVEVTNPTSFAYNSGFSGQRAVHTWRTRVRQLEELSFIRVHDGPYGLISYILILNPYSVIRTHFEKKTPTLDVGSVGELLRRTGEIGATDLDDLGEVPTKALVTVRRLRTGRKKTPPKPRQTRKTSTK